MLACAIPRFVLGRQILLSTLLFLSSVPVSAAQQSNFTDAHPSNFTGNSTIVDFRLSQIREDIHCYALPYGAIGFASHILTYYCLVINCLGKKPLIPWETQEHAWLNIALGSLQMVGTVVASALSISHCGGHINLQLFGIWMMLTSIATSLALMVGHGKCMIRPNQAYAPINQQTSRKTSKAGPSFQLKALGSSQHSPQRGRQHANARNSSSECLVRPPSLLTKSVAKSSSASDRRILWSLIAMILLGGCAVGAVGAVRIAIVAFPAIRTLRFITFGSLLIPVVYIVLASLSCLFSGPCKGSDPCSRNPVQGALKICFWFLVAMLLYMDWLLSAVTGNWWGFPHDLPRGDKILYWTYFGLKRIALLSS
ncbi:hypothetical protein FKW77_005204 [Venturia effusa]|uniref:MARVEL domain-containing protein n=1 Tax=Venturia effusa TaxID=50376 RepID=A0A517LMT3_9PEZI|nr:hypothetical protein FKW77_005204 [Venturia effusa]